MTVRPAIATTICTVTINSSQEREALRAAFPDSPWVELTGYASTDPRDTSDWLERSCRAGVQCDVLLISGHFANKFFGASPFELSIRNLERRSCQAECDGVLKRPTLVFLFGCNTLATKQPDQRSPRQYRQILVGDGLDPELAERVVTLRYGPLGDATRARVERVFSQKALIFGFSSTGPVGEVAGPRFSRYLLGARQPITKALQDRPADERTRRLLKGNWMKVFHGLNPVVAEGGSPLTPNECRFRDERTPRLDRLLSAERLLIEAPAQNALLVHDFLDEQSNWSGAEMAVLTRIKADDAARRDILAALPYLSRSLSVYFSMLQFARLLDWIGESELARQQARRLHELLVDGVTTEELDFLCSRDLAHVPSPEVMARNRRSVNFVRALPCLAARSATVRSFLQSLLSARARGLRLAAIDALTQLQLVEPTDLGPLQDLYRSADAELKESLLWAVAASAGGRVDVQRFIAAAVLDPDEGVAWTSAQVLKHLRPTDAQTLTALARALDRPDGFVRRSTAMVFASLAPLDRHTAELLRPFQEDADPVVRRAVRQALAASPAGSAGAPRVRVPRFRNSFHRGNTS